MNLQIKHVINTLLRKECIVDGYSGFVITGIMWRDPNLPQIEVSWFANGDLKCQWVEYWRITI